MQASKSSPIPWRVAKTFTAQHSAPERLMGGNARENAEGLSPCVPKPRPKVDVSMRKDKMIGRPRKGITLQQRFELQYTAEPMSGCWLWIGSFNNKGYGVIRHFGNQMLAHRMSVILDGRDPTGKLVMHKCDTPACVNPNHLVMGTNQENMIDCSKKGRICRGEKNPSSKVNEDVVKAIRESGLNGVQLANTYGVTKNTIYVIKRRRTWKHVV